MATAKTTFRAPRDFDTAAKKHWREVIDQLSAQRTFEETDLETVERYCRSVMTAREARDGLPTGPNGRPILTAIGSQGQLVQHPNLKTAREAERDAAQYATQLILTPESRKRMGVKAQRGASKFGLSGT